MSTGIDRLVVGDEQLVLAQFSNPPWTPWPRSGALQSSFPVSVLISCRMNMHVCSILPLNGDKIALTLLTRTTCRAMMKVLYFLLGGRPIGRTPDSGSGYPGSSPGLPANLFNGLAKALPQTWEHLGTEFSPI